jgi:signal transduction histidine kinase/FixJ family two-component response regulator
MRVLVVEDDPALSDVLRDFLRELGHEPVVTHSAEDALARMRLELPDAALLDIYLPGISGLDFLQLEATRESRVPIVAISGMAPESQARECVQLGAVDFLPKPIELERLREVLACLEPHARRRSAAAHRSERRRAPRAAVAVPVRVVEDGGSEWEAMSVDLSAVGVKLRASGPVSPGPAAKLSVALPDGDGALEVVATLVRSDDRGYAFDFVNLTQTQLGRLREFVGRRDAAAARAVEPHFRVLRAISRALSLSLDGDHMLRIALDALTRVTGHEISSLHLLSDDRTTLRLRGDRGLSPELREAQRELPVRQGVIGWVAATGETVHMANLAASPDLLPSAREVAEREGIRGFVCVPLQSRGVILGTLSLGRRSTEPFTDAEIALLEAAANQVSLALDNARLYSATRSQLEELKQAETQLVEGERLSAVGKLAAGLVHEITNPLTVVLGQAELVMKELADSTRGRERVRIIIQETSRAARLLQKVLQLSQPQPSERRPCALEDQARWVLELKRHELDRDGIRVVIEVAPVPSVYADQDQIRQVLLNLVQNAQQAMAKHPGPRVLTLGVSELDGRVRVEVRDTGPGIPPEALPRIFDAFFTTKPAGEGTGLGLWMCYGIIEQHQGRLYAESNPGGGAAFIIELPYRKAPR